ncbi:MAG TPA: hypothetical protein VJA26_00850 [Gammaproteobacteria bacterium]|nr:hypothetical protein [Gammaproteobacteria bacterium]
MTNRRVLLLVCAQVFGAAIFSIPEARAQRIDNTDVYVLADQLANEVELIREVMGRPYDDSPRLPVGGVTPAELYLQAQTVFRKSNQLAQELAGAKREAPPTAPDEEIRPADTHAVVEAALEQIRLVKRELGIDATVALEQRDDAIAPTGVFLVIIDVNRQLNLMLGESARPRDVFEQVSVAAIYAAAILAQHSAGAQVPSPAAFDGHKRMDDVYTRLLECIEIMSRVGPKAGVAVLRVSPRRNLPNNINSGHVYDLARILVADLAVLADVSQAQRVNPGLSTPSRVFPTQVYERAGILKEQLEALEALL